MLRPTMKILAKNLLILASAGSGKTFQLGNRVIGLVASGVAPEKIVALTFTRKAAGEFADSVLTKLAAAASDDLTATSLRRELALPTADFDESLEKVVRVLPRIMLGTMDGFFSRVVRGFQYELGLTGGKFDLLEGARAKTASDEILASILGETPAEGDEFFHAFRRATIGKEDQGVLDGLRDFVKCWQGHYRADHRLVWGPEELAGVHLEDWEKHKGGLYATVLRGLDDIDYTRKGQREAFEKALENLSNHTIGSGSLGGATSLLDSILTAAVGTGGPLVMKFYKEFTLTGPPGDALRELVNLAARCEMAAALHRTRAVREVVAVYDDRCEKQLRRRGLLGFDDVKRLMGRWAESEDARLRREAVDFRLDARYEHWLLDEFQDTSRADWLGLVPLIDEAAGAGDGTMFIVGDRKQAIYAWRGGEVGLFDEVIRNYGGDLAIETMEESWRSCPEVLGLVNRVCGDAMTMGELFGTAAENWKFENHFSTDSLTVTAKRGEARVEVVEGKLEERLERLGKLLDEIGIGERPLTCGVLVRSNSMVRKVADELRAKGFDVIEEGRREPAKDSPVGIVLANLLKWLANPADTFAQKVVAMSPLAAVLETRFGGHWQVAWEGLLGSVSESGFAAMIETVIGPLLAGWSDFGCRRAGDIMTALASLDARGGATPQQAADWIESLEIAQSPGIAAVQVMTIHKAKGLGFDVVVLPDVPNDSIPSSQYFDVAQGGDWITQTPPKWARDLIPEMREAEAVWMDSQRYEAFCLLYVALTRAKRGLYIFLEPPAKTQEPDKPSLANWLARAVGAEGQTGLVYQTGAPDWVETLPATRRAKTRVEILPLAAGVARRERLTPSGSKQKTTAAVTHSASGMRFGSEVHEAFEQVAWVDEETPILPASDAGKLVADLLLSTSLRPIFERKGRRIELFREQPVDAVLDGKWLSGVIDRLHLHRDAAGAVTLVEVIDFKTDALDDINELVLRYSGQMNAYREVMRQAYPGARVECILLSTRCCDQVIL